MTKDLVIFDGDCGVCSYFAGWIERHDYKDNFDVKPYQMLDLEMIHPDISVESAEKTMFLITSDKQVFTHARGVFEIAKRLTGIYGLLGGLIANAFFGAMFKPLYRLVASNRSRLSRLFGLNACAIDRD